MRLSVQRGRAHAFLCLLILLAFGRGVWELGAKSFWWDESLSLHRARQELGTVLSNEQVLTDNIHELTTVDMHPPAYFLLLWGALRVFGQTEFALRFPSLVFAVLIVPLLYATGRRLISTPGGVAAAAAGALSPMYLWYGQEARNYTMLAFLSLLSVNLFTRAFMQPQPLGSGPAPPRLRPGNPMSAKRPESVGWFLAFVGATVLLVLTHYLGILLIGFELVALTVILLARKQLRRPAMLALVALPILVVAVVAYLDTHFRLFTSRPGFRFVPLLELLRDLLNSFSLGLSVDVGAWPVLALDGLVLVVAVLGFAGLVRARGGKRSRAVGWLLLGYLFVPVLLVYGVSFVQPAYMNSRHMILITPAFYLLWGAGIAFAAAQARGTALQGLLVSACVLLLAGVGYSTYNYFNDPRYDKDHHREWGAYLREHVRPGDVVIVDPPHIAELYHYYAGSEVPWVGLPLLDRPRAETVAKLQELVGTYDRVWLALSHTPPWGDRRRFPEKWLNENAFRVSFQEFESYASTVRVAAYLREKPVVYSLPEGTQPLEARFSPAFSLVGYRPVSSAEPGALLHVELFWSVDRPIEEEASIVLNLVDAEGQVWGQGEQCAFNGLHPMWQWEPGKTLRDEHELAIFPGTPPGMYQLELKLVSRPVPEGCLGEPGRALVPIQAPTGRGDRVLLGEVAVGRGAAPASLAELGINRPHRVSFGELVLLAADFAPESVRPGDALNVVLYWEARSAPLPDARFRLRVEDGGGTVWEEAVIRPAGEAYPADRWQSGDRFKGQFRLWLPETLPGGTCRLELEPEGPDLAARRGLLGKIRGWLERERKAVELGQVEVPRDQALAPATAPPPPSDLAVTHPLTAVLGNQVRFLGYDLSGESVRAGERLSITLYWQALRPMATSYHVFAHLLGASGEIAAQKDGVPRNGAYPTNTWRPGEVVADRYDLDIDAGTPPGRYPLAVGMYRLENLKRLPVVDAAGQEAADDRIVLPEIRVLPAIVPSPPIPQRQLFYGYLPLLEKER